jgi:hypothetical protein
MAYFQYWIFEVLTETMQVSNVLKFVAMASVSKRMSKERASSNITDVTDVPVRQKRWANNQQVSG